MELHIRPSTAADLPEMLALYARARRFMAEAGNPTQWGADYPAPKLLEADIRLGQSYVCRSEQALEATFCFTNGVDDPSYQEIREGAWLDDAPYGVVHRIASAGKTPGAGAFCLTWCMAQCGNLRIDTHRDNHPMQSLLRKMGYRYCGVITYAGDGTERIAFQKRAVDG